MNEVSTFCPGECSNKTETGNKSKSNTSIYHNLLYILGNDYLDSKTIKS